MDFRHCLNKALDAYQAELFTCGEPLGLPTLRRTLVSHLADGQVFAPAERIVVTSGANQALEIMARMPFPNGKTAILVEQPSYDLYLRYLEAEGVPVCGIARSASGIDLGELEMRFRSGGIKFFYTIPRYHCPLGTSYSVEERKAIARLASKYESTSWKTITWLISEKRIDVVSGKRYYLTGFRDWEKLLRISVARARPERIEDGVRKIVEEVRREALSFV